MKNLKLAIAPLMLVLAAAACGPAADSISSAQAQPPVSNAVVWPDPVEGADSGQVHEYY